MSTRTWLLVAITLFVLIAPLGSQPTTASPPDNLTNGVITQTLYPDADTYSLSNAADVNFGEDPFLELTHEPNLDPATTGAIYLHFNLASIPANATILTASLLFNIPPGGYGEDCLVTLNPVVDLWFENALTYNSTPAISIDPGLQKHLGTGVSQIAWDIPEIVGYWRTVDNNGLEIRSIGESFDYVHFFYSRESPQPPELTIEYTLNP